MDKPCGCTIERLHQDILYEYLYIQYCPLHKAAPEMYEALKRALHHVNTHIGGWEGEVTRDIILEVMTKAEGK